MDTFMPISSQFADLNKLNIEKASSKRLEQQLSSFNIQKEEDTTSLENIHRIKDEKIKLKVVAEELESIMVQMMLKQMKKNMHKSGLIDGGNAEKIFDDMLTQEHSRNIAKGSKLGIAEMIYKQNEKYVGSPGLAISG